MAIFQLSIILLLLGSVGAGDVMDGGGAVNTIPGCEDVSCPELWCDNPYFPDGECCEQCPPGCMLNETVWHPVGAIYCEDPCDYCECYENGTSICEKIYCPEVKCENPIIEEGWCCAECELGGCLYKDALYGVGPMDTGDECEECTCAETGEHTCTSKACETTACQDVACPELPCKEEVALRGECCLYCPPGCVMEDVWYPFGPMKFEEESCEECLCKEDGSYDCQYKECPYDLPCPADVQFEGQCCLECPPCQFESNWYGVGVVEQSDSCQTCTCAADGDVDCVAVDCPPLNCPTEVQYIAEGECCPSCPPGCLYEDNWYGIGEMNTGDSCNVCECTAEGSSCNAVACEYANCPENVQIDAECGCKTCPPGCLQNEQWYGVGQMNTGDPCDVCTCNEDGSAACSRIECDAPACPNSVYVTSEDQCCPSCPPGCLFEDNWYGIGNMNDAKRCATCECHEDGSVVCVDIPCQPLPCPAEVQYTADGECCPRCPTGCEVNDQWYGATVEVPSEDACETCTCGDDGEVACTRNPCEDLSCSVGYLSAYREETSCCPECLTSCRYRRKNYAFNQEVPSRRRCRTCTCGANGRVRCASIPCPPLDCPEGYYPFKPYLECCPKCEPVRK